MSKPENEEKSNLMETSASKVLFDSRLIVLSDAINSVVAKQVIQALLAFDAHNPKEDIWIYLNSPGGEVSSGYGIFDVIRFIRPKTKIVVSGLAASIATVILLAAEKQNRFSLPNSRLLIHQPLIGGQVQGQATDIEITANEILKTREKIAELYHQETGQPIERVRRDIERDYWMNAREAMEYGLITRIVTSLRELV